MRKAHRYTASLMAVLWSALEAVSLAQTSTAKITGGITDSSHAVLQGAEITATNLATGVSRETRSNEEGNYSVAFLQPGDYRITAKMTGFKTASKSGVRLDVEQVARVDFVLNLGEITEIVDVTASGVALDTDSTTIGQLISEKQITDLPLNGRNFTQLLLVSSNAVTTFGEQGTFRAGVGDAFSLGGSRTASNSYLLDGLSNNDTYYQTPAIVPSIDALGEFKVQTNTYSAEFGAAENQINMSIRSGTNDFHGTTFYFGRNSALGARNFFDPSKITPLNQNQFGYTLGGPVWIPKLYNGRNRTFFFANYEQQITRQGNSAYLTVANPEELAGRFSTTIIDPLTGQPFPNNTIPQSRISTFAKGAMPYFVAPNTNTPQGNSFASIPNPIDSDQQHYRIDQNFGTKDSVFVRYSQFQYTASQITGGSPFTKEGQSHQVQKTRNVAGNYTHVFSPNLVNQFRMGWLKPEANNVGDPASHPIEALGVQGIAPWPSDAAFPNIQFANGIAPIGGANNVPIFTPSPSWEISDSLAINRGAHNFSVGFSFRHYTSYYAGGWSDGPGFYSFNGTTTGSPIADFLLGYASTANVTHVCPTCDKFGGFSNLIYKGFAPYFQDEWKASRRLTVTMGVRYDYNFLPLEERDHQGWFDTTNGGGIITSDKSIFDNHLEGDVLRYSGGRTYGSAPKNVFAPRLGFAFRPFDNNKTVIRAGGGIFYDQAEVKEQGTGFSYPGNGGKTYTSKPSDGIYIDLSQPFPPLPPATPATAANTLGFLFIQPAKRLSPYVEQWTFSIERELASNTKVEINYVGSHGVHLLGRENINQPYAYDSSSPLTVLERTPYPRAGLVMSHPWDHYSHYNAMNVKVERSVRDMTLLAGYTWSKNMDVKSATAGVAGDSAGWVGVMDPHNHRRDYARASYDANHRFVVSMVYDLPVGRGKRFLGSIGESANLVLGGWQVNGIVTYQSGFPFSINANDPGGVNQTFGNRADVNADPTKGFSKSRYEWFNTSVFSQPRIDIPGQSGFGNSGRNLVNAPGLANYDLSAFKNIRLTERIRWQLRFEAFNAFNHTQFLYPDANVNSPTFGVIGSARPGRIIQYGTKLIW